MERTAQLPKLLLSADGRVIPRISTAMSPSSNLPTMDGAHPDVDQAAIASGSATTAFCPTLTEVVGDESRPLVALSDPSQDLGRTASVSPSRRRTKLGTPITSRLDDLHELPPLARPMYAQDLRSGRRPIQASAVHTDVLTFNLAHKHHDIPMTPEQDNFSERSSGSGETLESFQPSTPQHGLEMRSFRPSPAAGGDSERIVHRVYEEKQERSQPSSAATPNTKRKRRPRSKSPSLQVLKMQSRPGRKFENQWRVGQAPTAGLKQTREQMNYERILTAISQYYLGNADSTWKAALRHNATEFDGKGLTEAIGTSVLMAGGLVAAGQAALASRMMEKTRELGAAMLLSQHPQVFYWLLEVSMDTTQTATGSVKRTTKARLGPVASKLLGPDHPVSILLQTPLRTEQRVVLRTAGQKVVHDYHVRTFGTYSYQTVAQQWYWGRIMAAAGLYDEALWLLQDLSSTLEQLYATPNSAVVVIGLVEQARVMVASGEASIRVECLLGDALRRMDVISSVQNQRITVTDAAELRLRKSGIIFPRLAAIRILGRVHVMRWNLGAAEAWFELAVEIAQNGLKEGSSARRLCEADLDATRTMEVERSMGVLSVEDPTSRLSPITSIIALAPVEP